MKVENEALKKVDWRCHAVDNHNDGVYGHATGEYFNGKEVNFFLPSAPAMFLNVAVQAHKRRTAIDLSKVFITTPQGTMPEDEALLFDYFEDLAIEVIFSYTAIEAFANEVIPGEAKYQIKKPKKDQPVELVKNQIEREVNLNEKLKKVIPQVCGVKSPAGFKTWADYQKLEDIRDRLIHLKSVDRRPLGPEHQTMWGLMLAERHLVFPDIAARLIGSFDTLVGDRRWFGRYQFIDPQPGTSKKKPTSK